MTVIEQITPDQLVEQRDALVGRLFGAALGTIDVFTVYIGDRLGLYRALADAGPCTADALATRTGTAARYAREWLEQQAVAAILGVDDVSAAPEARRYHLLAGHAEVLLGRDSLNHLAPLMRVQVATAQALPAILHAFRTGGGVPYADYGVDAREGQADLNRPSFLNLLASAWLPAIPEVQARLQADPPARVADIACGAGWSSIALARAYPSVQVDGYDSDESSIADARANAAQAGLADQVRFHVHDAATSLPERAYDLMMVFEAIHDMARPVEALRAIRGALAQGGAVIVMDERVGEAFTAPGDEIERFFYGASVLFCLPTGMSEQPSAGTGTMMRPATLRAYARDAGYRDTEILPIENPFYRFYRLFA